MYLAESERRGNQRRVYQHRCQPSGLISGWIEAFVCSGTCLGSEENKHQDTLQKLAYLERRQGDLSFLPENLFGSGNQTQNSPSRKKLNLCNFSVCLFTVSGLFVPLCCLDIIIT